MSDKTPSHRPKPILMNRSPKAEDNRSEFQLPSTPLTAGSLATNDILRLQRTVGNQAVRRLLADSPQHNTERELRRVSPTNAPFPIIQRMPPKNVKEIFSNSTTDLADYIDDILEATGRTDEELLPTDAVINLIARLTTAYEDDPASFGSKSRKKEKIYDELKKRITNASEQLKNDPDRSQEDFQTFFTDTEL